MSELGPLFEAVESQRGAQVEAVESQSNTDPSESPSETDQTGYEHPDLDDSAWEELDALDRLFRRSQHLRRAEEYRNFLKFVSRFSGYSPFNAALLHLQNPGVKYVATHRQWERDFGRQVDPDARPYVILQPFGPVLFVYDVEDTVPIGTGTEGLPDHVKNPFAVEGKIGRQKWARIISNCREERVAIRKSNNLHRNYAGRIEVVNPKNCRFLESDEKNCTHVVTIREGKEVSREEKFATLAHELAHLFCGHLGSKEEDWWPNRSNEEKPVKELEAESVAYLVCRRAGLKSQSEWYLRNHLTKMDDEDLLPPIRVRIILDAVNYIEKLGESAFESKRG